jgi:diguanylate cyclase (GGDEF)-like protein
VIEAFASPTKHTQNIILSIGCYPGVSVDQGWALFSFTKNLQDVVSSPDESHLLRSQVAAYKKQIPLMYMIVDANVIALSFTHFSTAPHWLTIFVPAVLVLASMLRMVGWWHMRNDVVSDAQAIRALRSTNIFALVLGSAFVTWALMLYPYGDVYAQMHVVFFIGITFVACAFCLMHVRSAAYLLMGVVLVPFTAFFGLSDNPVLVAIALNLIAVSLAISVILQTYYRDFIALNKSKSELQRLHDEVVHLADSDSLTQLANRRRFFSELNRRLIATTPQGRRVTIGVLDLDGFKGVNDAYGHRAGDQVLIEVGRRLRSLGSDFSCIARLGGDEFGVILNGERSDAELRSIGLAICMALREPYNIIETQVQLGGSVGFASAPGAADTSEKLYECADYALYYAKNNARGTAVLFTADHQGEIRELSLVDQTLRHINPREELSLAFQPIIDIEGGKIVACEALARWQNPQLGCVQPSSFIRAAERSGLIGPLTDLLLEKALVSSIDWPSDMRLSFNLSAYDVTTTDSAERIVNIIHASRVDPSRIDFEVTETSLMQDFDRARASLEYFKNFGVKIALDDFGSGYSSLSYIHQLPIDKIKIDRSFVTDIESGGAGSEIITTIIALCRSLNLLCIVEGIETLGQVEILRNLGCRYMQGYYFARPMNAEKLRHHISDMSRSKRAAA